MLRSPVRSTPSYIGLSALVVLRALVLSWQSEHWRGVGAAQAEQGLLVAAAERSTVTASAGAAGLLGALDVVRRDLELVGGVELDPDRPRRAP